MLIKYLARPKKKNANEYLVKDVHIIIGDGSEQFHQNVYIKDGVIKEISSDDIAVKTAQIISGTGKTLIQNRRRLVVSDDGYGDTRFHSIF